MLMFMSSLSPHRSKYKEVVRRVWVSDESNLVQCLWRYLKVGMTVVHDKTQGFFADNLALVRNCRSNLSVLRCLHRLSLEAGHSISSYSVRLPRLMLSSGCCCCSSEAGYKRKESDPEQDGGTVLNKGCRKLSDSKVFLVFLKVWVHSDTWSTLLSSSKLLFSRGEQFTVTCLLKLFNMLAHTGLSHVQLFNRLGGNGRLLPEF